MPKFRREGSLYFGGQEVHRSLVREDLATSGWKDGRSECVGAHLHPQHILNKMLFSVHVCLSFRYIPDHKNRETVARKLFKLSLELDELLNKGITRFTERLCDLVWRRVFEIRWCTIHSICYTIRPSSIRPSKSSVCVICKPTLPV